MTSYLEVCCTWADFQGTVDDGGLKKTLCTSDAAALGNIEVNPGLVGSCSSDLQPSGWPFCSDTTWPPIDHAFSNKTEDQLL